MKWKMEFAAMPGCGYTKGDEALLSRYKICVYAISKNEAQFVDRWMDAVSEADIVVVADTGSTDNTVEKLRARGAVVYPETIDPWRFDRARNVAMDHIPDDVDICVSNDIDEVFEPGWRDKLEQAWRPEHTRAQYWFTWTRRADGMPEKKFPMQKIHRRHDFRWVHPVHEVLEYSGQDPDKVVSIDSIVLHHYPDPSKPRDQYLPLLELSSKESPQDDRTMFWLGREYVFKGRNDDGIYTLQQHLNLPGAVWDEERSASMRFIARAYRAKGNNAEAKSWLFKAVAECRHIREPWLDLAMLGNDTEDWPLSFFAAEMGLAVKMSTGSYLIEPAAWGHSLYDLGAVACYWLQMYEQAFDHAQKACAISPDDKRLAGNLSIIEKKLHDGGDGT